MDLKDLLESLASSKGRQDDDASDELMAISSRRLHKMTKVRDDQRTTRFECQAALLSAQLEFTTYWPVNRWEKKDEHMAFLDAAVLSSRAISDANNAVDVVAALDMALSKENACGSTRVRSAVRDLLTRIATDVLLELARKEAAAAKTKSV